MKLNEFIDGKNNKIINKLISSHTHTNTHTCFHMENAIMVVPVCNINRD